MSGVKQSSRVVKDSADVLSSTRDQFDLIGGGSSRLSNREEREDAWISNRNKL